MIKYHGLEMSRGVLFQIGNHWPTYWLTKRRYTKRCQTKPKLTCHPQPWYCSSSSSKTSLCMIFGSNPTVQMLPSSLKQANPKVDHFLMKQTSLLEAQRTCQRLAGPRHLGRGEVRRVCVSGCQCWCPCPDRRGDNHPGSFSPHFSFLEKIF